MIEVELLTREWVELREESQPGRIVLRPVDSDIPPARGRRRLDLSRSGEATAKSPGPTDRLEGRKGEWSLSDRTLTVSAGNWKGTYLIAEVADDQLVLCPQ
jgi:hypothetical protein